MISAPEVTTVLPVNRRLSVGASGRGRGAHENCDPALHAPRGTLLSLLTRKKSEVGSWKQGLERESPGVDRMQTALMVLADVVC